MALLKPYPTVRARLFPIGNRTAVRFGQRSCALASPNSGRRAFGDPEIVAPNLAFRGWETITYLCRTRIRPHFGRNAYLLSQVEGTRGLLVPDLLAIRDWSVAISFVGFYRSDDSKPLCCCRGSAKDSWFCSGTQITLPERGDDGFKPFPGSGVVSIENVPPKEKYRFPFDDARQCHE